MLLLLVIPIKKHIDIKDNFDLVLLLLSSSLVFKVSKAGESKKLN
jgi:hypothetical protein